MVHSSVARPTLAHLSAAYACSAHAARASNHHCRRPPLGATRARAMQGILKALSAPSRALEMDPPPSAVSFSPSLRAPMPSSPPLHQPPPTPHSDHRGPPHPYLNQATKGNYVDLPQLQGPSRITAGHQRTSSTVECRRATPPPSPCRRPIRLVSPRM
jgi:hypothetical protein